MPEAPASSCRRGPACAAEYQERISGPLMDRFDLTVEVPAVSASDLIGVVEATGYTAALPEPTKPPVDHARELLRDLRLAIVLAVPVVALAMVPALQFTYWQWASLALAAPSLAVIRRPRTPLKFAGGWPVNLVPVNVSQDGSGDPSTSVAE